MRIVIVGANGAGKTWLARKLSAKLGLPVVSNDALALERRWRYQPHARVALKRAKAIAEDRWILEGGPSILEAAVLERSDLVIWLDLPRGRRVWQIELRSLRFIGRVRPEHPPGNRELPGPRQWRFLLKAWKSDSAMRDAVGQALLGENLPVVRVCNRTDLSRLIERAGEGAEGFEIDLLGAFGGRDATTAQHVLDRGV